MQIVISGIPIDVQKKNIKNMHLYVKPPDGHVIISAPQTIDDKAIEIYARTNLSWSKRQIQQFQNQPRSSKRQYVSGETIYVWGKQYFIQFIPDNKKNSFLLQGNTASGRRNIWLPAGVPAMWRRKSSGLIFSWHRNRLNAWSLSFSMS